MYVLHGFLPVRGGGGSMSDTSAVQSDLDEENDDDVMLRVM